MEILLLFLPLLASIVSGFFGKFIGDRNSEIITSLFVSISAVLSLIIFYEVIANNYQNNVVITTWINSGILNVNWSGNLRQLGDAPHVFHPLVGGGSPVRAQPQIPGPEILQDVSLEVIAVGLGKITRLA